MKLFKQLFLVFALLCATQVWAEPLEGRDYKVLSPAQPTHSGKKIEVLEFFFYGCIHCFHLNPHIEAWEKKLPKDVKFSYVPAMFNPTWEVSGRAYYALEALGERKRLHDALFDAWDQNNLLADEESTTEFVAKHGVDRNKFKQAYDSFGVQNQVMRAKQMGPAYGIRGTPTLIVDGRYVITGLQPVETIQVLNALIDKVRKERGGRK